MSTTTEVVPGAGWYRDPSNPSLARWWDGVAWGHQTQELPPAAPAPTADAAPVPAPAPAPVPAPPAPVEVPQQDPAQFASAPPPLPTAVTAPPADVPVPASMIAVADPFEASPAEESPAKSKRSLPSLSLPSVKGSPLVLLLVVVVLLVGGWFAWKSLHGSSGSGGTASPASTPSHVTTAPGGVAAKAIKLPKTTPAELGGVPWFVDPVAMSQAEHIVATQKGGGHHVVGAFYGQTLKERFFALESNVTAADRKPASIAAQKLRAQRLLASIAGNPVSKVAWSKATANGVSTSCISGISGGKTLSLCSWQNATARVVVSRPGTVPATQQLLLKVVNGLS